MNAVERPAVQQHKHRRFKRKVFYCAGVMDLLTIDQHDKWKRFGLYLHLGLDPFTGQIVWLKIWWTNRNPILIASYYIGSARELGGGYSPRLLCSDSKLIGVPLVRQSDPGTENNAVANCHTSIRHLLDLSLEGTLQHRWMNKHGKNIKPEAQWSDFRRHWAPGFETILLQGVLNGLYDADEADPVERSVYLLLSCCRSLIHHVKAGVPMVGNSLASKRTGCVGRPPKFRKETGG